MTDADLFADIEAAEKANGSVISCQVCDGLALMSPETKARVESALAGTIGERKLADILTRNGYPTGRRAIYYHRKGHTQREPN